MKLIRKLVQDKYTSFFLGNKNKQIKIYDFFQAISMASAYLKLKKEITYDKNRLRFLSALFQKYHWFSIIKAFEEVASNEKIKKEEINPFVKNRCSILVKEDFNDLLKIIEEDETVLIEFFNQFPFEFEKIKKEPVFSDRKIRWSVGVVKMEKQKSRGIT